MDSLAQSDFSSGVARLSQIPVSIVLALSGVGIPVYDSRGRLIGAINVTAISERLARAARRREIVSFLRKELLAVNF